MKEKLKILAQAALGAAIGGAVTVIEPLLDEPAALLTNPRQFALRVAIGAATGVLLYLKKSQGIRAALAELKAGKSLG